MILLTFNIINPENKENRFSEDELLNITENNTKTILRILEINNSFATFFVEISVVEKLLNLLKLIISKGHEVAFYNENSRVTEIEKVKEIAETFLEKSSKGIRQKDKIISVSELKRIGFSYISNIENANILFPLKRLERSTEITENLGLSIVPESISPYSQLPYNDFVFQAIPMKYYQSMVLETLKKDNFVLIYLNSWQFTDFEKFKLKIPFYRKYNSGRKMEDKLQEFLSWMNEKELAESRMKDFIF